MIEKPIVFIDSGIGGIPYLVWARKNLPEENFIYIGDNKNFPYGDKPAESVRKILIDLCGRVIDVFVPKLIVIACNTASVVGLAALRERYPLPFVGVVPAVKPAAEGSPFKRIGVFATNRTVEDEYTRKLIEDFASDCRVLSYPGSDTVEFIERKFLFSSAEERSDFVRRIAAPFIRDRIDSLVLGCTHFVYLYDDMERILNGKVKIIDSREGVAKQIVRLVRKTGPTEGEKEEDKLFITSEDAGGELYRGYGRRYGLEYKGVF